MSPIGKSGKYHISPHNMRMANDEPAGESKSMGAKSRPDDQEPGGEEANGDGTHHHEIHMHEDGSAHSLHTHPDGRKEGPTEHGSYEEARDHMDRMMGREGDEDDAHGDGGESDGDGEDMAGMYERGCD